MVQAFECAAGVTTAEPHAAEHTGRESISEQVVAARAATHRKTIPFCSERACATDIHPEQIFTQTFESHNCLGLPAAFHGECPHFAASLTAEALRWVVQDS